MAIIQKKSDIDKRVINVKVSIDVYEELERVKSRIEANEDVVADLDAEFERHIARTLRRVSEELDAFESSPMEA